MKDEYLLAPEELALVARGADLLLEEVAGQPIDLRTRLTVLAAVLNDDRKLVACLYGHIVSLEELVNAVAAHLVSEAKHRSPSSTRPSIGTDRAMVLLGDAVRDALSLFEGRTGTGPDYVERIESEVWL